MEYLGSQWIEPEFAENGGSGSGYYERIEGVGSYYGTSEPLFDFYDQGSYGGGSGYYTGSFHYGSGQWSSDGATTYVDSTWGSDGHYDSEWGAGSYSSSTLMVLRIFW